MNRIAAGMAALLLTSTAALAIDTAPAASDAATCRKRLAGSTIVETVCSDAGLRETDRVAFQFAAYVLASFKGKPLADLQTVGRDWTRLHNKCGRDKNCLFKSYAMILTYWWDIAWSEDGPMLKQQKRGRP